MADRLANCTRPETSQAFSFSHAGAANNLDTATQVVSNSHR